jgi:hypothetical protein
MLADPSTGGCSDGLHPDRPNENQGAESVLSYLLSLSEVHRFSRASAKDQAQAKSNRAVGSTSWSKTPEAV